VLLTPLEFAGPEGAPPSL